MKKVDRWLMRNLTQNLALMRAACLLDQWDRATSYADAVHELCRLCDERGKSQTKEEWLDE